MKILKKNIVAILLTIMLVSLTISASPVLAEDPPKFYLLKQSGTNYIVEAIQGADSASDFYGYISSSGQTPFMEAYVSKIYLYQEDEGQLSLMIHHNKEGVGPEWMRVDFDFELEGLDDVDLGVFSDDPNHRWNGRTEFDLAEEPEGEWMYRLNSDGGYLEGLPDSEWSITITPVFDESITAWNYQNSTIPEDDLIKLDLIQPITITNIIPEDLSPDSGVGLDFDTITGPGSIGVTRLFGCVPSEFPTAFFDIRVTVGFDGVVKLTMTYDDEGMTKGQEKNLKLWATDRIIPGDVNFDGKVNQKDIVAIQKAIVLWGEPVDPNSNNNGDGNGFNPYTDVNCDGEVNQDDLDIALANFGQKSPWVNITTGINIVENELYGDTEHFSIFRGR